MTNEEAKKSLEYLISDESNETPPNYISEIILAIKALEKQIPKKPINLTGYSTDYICPTCHTKYIRWIWHSGSCGTFKNNYCHKCGQAINWDYSEVVIT